MLLKAQTLLKLISVTDLFYIRAKIDIATLLFRNHLHYIKLECGQKHKLCWLNFQASHVVRG